MKDVLVEHREIGELAHLERTDFILHVVLEGNVFGICLERLICRDGLLGPTVHIGVLLLGIRAVARNGHLDLLERRLAGDPDHRSHRR